MTTRSSLYERTLERAVNCMFGVLWRTHALTLPLVRLMAAAQADEAEQQRRTPGVRRGGGHR